MQRTADYPRILAGPRPDIQALRAVAVVSVLLFHVDAWFMGGGFLGVDVFFVISGFLITHILYHRVAHGVMPLMEFYGNRIRRLLPAATVTIGLTLAAGYFLSPVDDFRRLGAAALHAQFWVSNILFWSEAGYFDADAHFKPLLHFWSLSVEEQFYVFWPWLVIGAAALGRRATPLMIGALGLASLAAAQLFLAPSPSAAFFLMPFRAFEFAAGAMLVFLPVVRTDAIRTAMVAIGLALIGFSIVAMNIADYPSPGLWSLVPVAGTVLCIAGGAGSLGRRLSPRPVQFVGDISYSLYLAHWPIIVFWRIAVSDPFTPVDQVVLVVLSAAAGYALYRLVERPMRDPAFWKNGYTVLPGVAGLVTTVYIGANVWASGGWAWRVPEEVQNIATSVTSLREERAEMIRRMKRGPNKLPSDKKIAIIGDSHGNDMFSALVQNGARQVTLVEISYKCQATVGERPIEGDSSVHIRSAADAEECAKAFKELLSHKSLADASVVVLAPRWKSWAAMDLAATLDELRRHTSAEIVVFGPTVEFKPAVPTLVEKYGKVKGIDNWASRYENAAIRELSARMGEIAAEAGAIYVDKFSVMCPRGPCPIFVPDTRSVTIWDYGHWTARGAKYFGERLKESSPTAAKLLFS